MTRILSQKKEFIFPQGTVCESCHASTVMPLPKGNVLTAFFGGSKEGNKDVTIYTVLRRNGVWETPQQIFVDRNQPHWNPVLFRRLNGDIVLFLKHGKSPAVWKTYTAVSKDGGLTFSAPTELVKGDDSGGRGPVKNKCLRLSDGRVLAPASSELISWRCFADISCDDGKTFTRSNFVLRPKVAGLPVGMIQPTLWESETGVHMLVRTNKGYIYRSDSKDGVHWCKAYKTPLLNNNSGIDITKLSDGSLVLISNPIGVSWGDRAPITLMRSFDDGNTFEEFIQLETITGDHEFSYPAIVSDGMKLYITYTYERKTMAYWEMEIV